jgi:hypothetical protein
MIQLAQSVLGLGNFVFFHENLNGQLQESEKIWLDNEIN